MVRWRLWKHCSDLPIYSDFFEETFVYIFVSLKFNWNETFWDKSKHCERKEFEYKKVTQEDKRPILETSLGKKRWSLFPVPLLFFFALLAFSLLLQRPEKTKRKQKSEKKAEGLLLQQQMAKTFLTQSLLSSHPSKWRLQNFDLSQRP